MSGLRSEALLGAKVHDFDDSPAEDLEGVNVTLIFVPEGGATLTGLYLKGSEVNTLDDYTNTGVLKAGVQIAPPLGTVWGKVTGSSGQINYVLG